MQLTDVVGLNKATDASTPDRDSLVGIQKLGLQFKFSKTYPRWSGLLT
jgi:hypothetical protein